MFQRQLGVLLLLAFSYTAWAQPGAILNIEKPAKYEKRTLPSEKPTDKPINPLRRATQNLSSHYNFHFNATQKLNEILYNARAANKDDFSKLLRFYAITLDATSSQKGDLDSILIKANDAILLHDLRSDWVDDFYLLMGKAFYYRKEFDSALITFQYVNYAFQPRNKDEIGFPKAVGTNVSGQSNAYTISSKENNSLLNKIASHPPARNESLLWLIRCFAENDQTADAWSLIETLKRDKQFPDRLKGQLHELQAYLFYQEKQYDSAATHLEAALSEFPIVEKARQEYLLAQLYEKSSNVKKADYWYDKVIGHTTDLIMEAYARINKIKLITDASSNKKIAEQISELLKMVNKEKYEDYKHYIYYAVAQMEKSRDSISPALFYLQQSAANSKSDQEFRNKALLELGDLAWDQRNYKLSAQGYDSLTVNDSTTGIDIIELNQRKNVLGKIISYLDVIHVEDSLLRIAEMPEIERNVLLKTLLRQLRKAQGLKEDVSASANYSGSTSTLTDPTKEDKPNDLFASNNTKGDWYFYNISLKSKGIRDFESIWGKRPNVDNWRRAKAINAMAGPGLNQGKATDKENVTAANTKTQPETLTLDALIANLPLDSNSKQASLDTIASALYQLGKVFRETLNDCASVIHYNEQLLNRFPKNKHIEEVLFGLYFCHQQLGNTAKANTYKDYLAENYSNSRYVRMINDPVSVAKENQQLTTQATLTYEKIYESFIEGNFQQALADKKLADSTFGENYWTPQLLYIESIYHIKQRNDSLAMAILNKLQMLFPTNAMAAKAKTLADVLSKREELEKYLTELNIERATEDSVFISMERAKQNKIVQKTESTIVPQKINTTTPSIPIPEPTRLKEVVNTAPLRAEKDTTSFSKRISTKVDTSSFIKPVIKAPVSGYSFNPSEEHLVILVLQKVDVVYLNEAKNALNRYNKEKLPEQKTELQSLTYSDEIRLLKTSSFPDLISAEAYKKQLMTDAPRTIFPWLPSSKYYFITISPSNLELMQTKKEIDRYQQLFKENIPLK